MSETFELKSIIYKYKSFFENKNDIFAFVLELHKNVEFNSSMLSYAKLYKDISDIYKDPTPAYQSDKYTPDPIDKNNMTDNDIFVFGSNTEGKHGAGAAKAAVGHYGAIYGQAKGLQGNSYAIITKDLNVGNKSVSIEHIEEQVNELIDFAIDNKDKTFWVTKLGCGLGGFEIAEIAPIFANKILPENVILPIEFVLPHYYMEYVYSDKFKTFYHIKISDKKITQVSSNPTIIRTVKIDFDNMNNIFEHIPYDVTVSSKEEYDFALEYTLKKML